MPTFGAFGGVNSANFGAVGTADDVLSQMLPTISGHTYVLDFELAHDNTNSANDFSASWNGSSVLSLVNVASFDYTEYTFSVVASGASTDLAFAGRENPAWYGLDNVSVVDVTTPEPGFMLLLAVGLVSLYAFRRRRHA